MGSITFHGGIDTIGGSMFLVESGNTRIFLDFGNNFSAERKFFEFPTLRAQNINDLLKLGLIPDLKGLYRFDEGAKPLISGVFLSHAHYDHYGYFPCLREDTKIYLGACAHRLIDLRTHMSPATWTNKFDHLQYTPFTTGDEVNVENDLIVRPIHVDHSIPGAYGFVLHAENKTLVYTGDLRAHGYANPLTADFLNRVAKEDVDVLLTEGTNVRPTEDHLEMQKLDREQDVLEKLTWLCDSDGLVLYDMTLEDIDRMRTVWQAAKKIGRRVVYDSRQAYLLLSLNAEQQFLANLPEKGDFDIYLERLKTPGEDKYTETFKSGRGFHEKTLLETLERDDLFIWGPEGRRQILDNGNEYLLCTSFGISLLFQFMEKQRDINGTFVYGRSEPYTEVADLTLRKMQNWVQICNMAFDSAHTSGHVSQENIASMIEIMDPAITIPVHTEHPEQFKTITPRLFLPRPGGTYTF